MNPWKFVNKREIVFAGSYRENMESELMMLVVFNYDEALILKLIELCDTRSEIELIIDLMTMPWDVEITFNGNVRVFNL